MALVSVDPPRSLEASLRDLIQIGGAGLRRVAEKAG
jgi:hypothetical protein